MTWDDLCHQVENPHLYQSKTAMPLIKLATFGNHKTDAGSFRHDSNVIEVYGLEGDYDGGVVTLEEAAAKLEKRGIMAIVFTSPSHTPTKPRWRVLAPLSHSIEPEERSHWVGMLNDALGGILATESFTLSQTFYIGKANDDYQAIKVIGEPIDLKEGQWEPAFPVSKEKTIEGNPIPKNERIAEYTRQILSNEAYYQPSMRLAAEYFNSGMGRDAAIATVRSIMENHPNPNKDIGKYIAKLDGYLNEKDFTHELSPELKQLQERVLAKQTSVSPGREDLSQQFIDEIKSRFITDLEPKATKWVVEGTIPEGVGVISGSGGVGKTNSLLPLAVFAIGFEFMDAEYMSCLRDRHLVYMTEDISQAKAVLYGIIKHQKVIGKPIDAQDLLNRVHLIDSERMPAVAVAKFVRAIGKEFSFTQTHHRVPGMVNGKLKLHRMEELKTPVINAPLVVFDTASSCFDLEDENNNTEVSKFMAGLKEVYEQTGTSCWLVDHLPKTANGKSVEELRNVSARGASAKRDNAHWDAVLSKDEHSEQRVLAMCKVRCMLTSHEIAFDSQVMNTVIVDDFGRSIESNYIVSTPRVYFAEVESRHEANAEAKAEKVEKRILDWLSDHQDELPNIETFRKGVGIRTNDFRSHLDRLIGNGLIRVADLTTEDKEKSGRKSGKKYVLNSKGKP